MAGHGQSSPWVTQSLPLNCLNHGLGPRCEEHREGRVVDGSDRSPLWPELCESRWGLNFIPQSAEATEGGK